MAAAEQFLDILIDAGQKPLSSWDKQDTQSDARKPNLFYFSFTNANLGVNLDFPRMELISEPGKDLFREVNFKDIPKLETYLNEMDFARTLPLTLSHFLTYGIEIGGGLLPEQRATLDMFKMTKNIEAIKILSTRKSDEKLTKQAWYNKCEEAKHRILSILDRKKNSTGEVVVLDKIQIVKEDRREDEQKDWDKYGLILDTQNTFQNAAIVKKLVFMHSFMTALQIPNNDGEDPYKNVVYNLDKITEKLLLAMEINIRNRMDVLDSAAALNMIPTLKGKQKYESREDVAKRPKYYKDGFMHLLTLVRPGKPLTNYPKILENEVNRIEREIDLQSKDALREQGTAPDTSGEWPTGAGGVDYEPLGGQDEVVEDVSVDTQRHTDGPTDRRRGHFVGYCECPSDCSSDCSSDGGSDREEDVGWRAAPGVYREHRAEQIFRTQRRALQPCPEPEPASDLDEPCSLPTCGNPTEYCNCHPGRPLQHATYFACETYPHLSLAVQAAPSRQGGGQHVLRLARVPRTELAAEQLPSVEAIASDAATPAEAAFERKVQDLIRAQGAAGVLAGTCEMPFPKDSPPVTWQVHSFARAVRDAWRGRKDSGADKGYVASLAPLHDPRSGKGFVALVDTRGGGVSGQKFKLQQGLSSHADLGAAVGHFESRGAKSKGSHAAYLLLDNHFAAAAQAGARKGRLACVRAAYDDGRRELSWEECTKHFQGDPLLGLNYQMLYADMRKHVNKHGELGPHYLNSLSNSASDNLVAWEALSLFVEDMQHH